MNKWYMVGVGVASVLGFCALVACGDTPQQAYQATTTGVIFALVVGYFVRFK